jgi:hypothetical protein
LGYVPKIGEAPLDWGSGIHRGVAEWYRARWRQEISEAKIILDTRAWFDNKLCLKNHPRNGENLELCLQEYFRQYQGEQFRPLETKDSLAVELSFAVPLYANEHTDVLLTGKIDAIGKYGADQRLVFKDIKTSTATGYKTHAEEQASRSQFHIYTWVLRKLGFRDLDRPSQAYLPVVIDGLYINKDKVGCKLYRGPVTVIEQFMVTRTMEFVMQKAKELAELPDEKVWTHNYSQCHGRYSRCKFYDVCQVPTESQSIALNMLFNRREYNPATFDE